MTQTFMPEGIMASSKILDWEIPSGSASIRGGGARTLQRTLRPEDPSKPELVGPTSVGERACVLVSNELEVSRGRINSNRVGFLSFCLVYVWFQQLGNLIYFCLHFFC